MPGLDPNKECGIFIVRFIDKQGNMGGVGITASPGLVWNSMDA